jgi:hypothetical protein
MIEKVILSNTSLPRLWALGEKEEFPQIHFPRGCLKL